MSATRETPPSERNNISEIYETRAYGFQIDYSGEKPLYHFYINPLDFYTIVTKGAGGRGFLYQRFIEVIENNDVLKRAKEIGGSSSGAFADLFMAIPFEKNERSRAIEDFNNTNGQDIIGDTTAWKIYRILTSPLYVTSKLMDWLSKGVDWVAKECNQSFLEIIGWPLGLVSTILKVGKMISPTNIAGIYNLATIGALYHGKILHKKIKELIKQNTWTGIQRILEKNPLQKDKILNDLVAIKLLEKINGTYRIIDDITFAHFAHLAKLPDSQFKEIYLTGVERHGNHKLIVFNKKNTPHKAIHEAARISPSIPRLYKDLMHDGVRMMDGGCDDNDPVQHATPPSITPFQAQYGVEAKQACLNARLEYKEGLDNLLWHTPPEIHDESKRTPPPPDSSSMKIKKWIYKKITGMDTFAADAKITEVIQKHYAQRTVQLEDFDIGLLDLDIGEKRRKELCATPDALAEKFFKNHQGEKVSIKTYRQPTNEIPKKDSIPEHDPQDMPLQLRIMLLRDLKNYTDVQTQDIFYIPGFKEAKDNPEKREALLREYKQLREKESARLELLITIKNGNDVVADLLKKTKKVDSATSTTKVCERMRIKPQVAGCQQGAPRWHGMGTSHEIKITIHDKPQTLPPVIIHSLPDWKPRGLTAS